MPLELTILAALAIAAAVYVFRLHITTHNEDRSDLLDDLSDRIGAVETLAEDLNKACALSKELKTKCAELEERLDREVAATNRANNNIIQKLNKHEMQLGQVPRGK